MFILILILILIGASMFCVIIGGNKNKSKKEQMIENQEQVNFLKDYKNKKYKNNK